MSFQNRSRASQLIDFDGLTFGNINPSDIDAVIEYKNKAFIFIELKSKGVDISTGQRILLERLVDGLNKPSIALVAHHETWDCKEDVILAKAIVFKYYLYGRWNVPIDKITVRKAVETMLEKL
jgi:hypothetical protein